MRWHVEVSSIGKTDVQKFCVEAESWQRALQAARAQRGEEGPMSGFSIELLEEGYRAVDPLARVRFIVKRAPDDTPITTPLAKDGKGGIAPSPPSSVPTPSGGVSEKADAKVPPAPTSSTPSTTKSGPPRPTVNDKSNGPVSTEKKGLMTKAEATTEVKDKKPSDPPAPEPVPTARLLPIGAPIPGLPNVKILSSREQNPTDASPLTYREYSFAVAAGTTEEVAANVLKGQLRLIDAHIESAKMGKLVNLAVFDVEFTGKPPAPPLATLTWKDWKGEPVIGYPRRGAAPKQPTPPSTPPPGAAPEAKASSPAPASPSAPPPSMSAGAPRPQESPAVAPPAAAPAFPVPATAPAAMPAAPGVPPPPAAIIAAGAQASTQQGTATSAVAAVAAGLQPNPPASVPPPQPASIPPAGSVPPPAIVPSQPPPPNASGAASTPPATNGSAPPPAAVQPAPTNGEAPATSTSEPPPRQPSSPDGMVRTPSGRFVRGRITGDELITALFESMHDLHFLRDALDGGQFCLALATEVLPARAALIHFFDVEKREWVVACTRGKDASRLLTMRTPESDELLRHAARKRRALVMSNATTATAERYQTLGGSRSMIIAPIMQAGRALGALEIINPLDGMPFNEDEGNAMTYIAEQYAEYLGSRGIVLDRERIQNAASPR